jgi:tetratricopeptide (TPR) repeat protein
MGGMRGFGGGVQSRMISPGGGAGMARGGYGMGARQGVNMAGRSLGTSNFGRAGMAGGAMGMGRSAYGLGARAPITSAARMGAANSFVRTGVNNGIRSGLTGTSLNRASLSNGSLNVNRTNLTNNINNVNSNRLLNGSFGRSGYYGGFGYGGYGRGNGFGRGFGFGYPWWYGGYGLGYGLGGFGLGFGLGSLYGLGYGGYGLGYGLGGWGGYGSYGYGYDPYLYGSSLYDWGYSNYYNPYYYGGYGLGGYGNYGLGAFGYPSSTSVVVQPTVYDYSQPINTAATPPEPAVADSVGTSFDSARDAFKAGEYAKALEQTDQAIRQMPNDAALHEFRGVVLFALHRYADAAVPLYAVLAVGPGWDWSTLVGLYPNVAVYTEQLRALEAYCRLNPQAAPARFVLAYLYLTQGNTDEAVQQLKRVVALLPKDTVSAQLIQRLEKTSGPAGAAPANQPPAAPPAPGLNPTALTAPNSPVKEGRLEGAWTAQPDPETTITLTFQDQGKFSWKIAHKGRDRLIQGKLTAGNGLLTLAQEHGAPMVADVTWSDETHFTFKVPGAGPDDPGLHFEKTP